LKIRVWDEMAIAMALPEFAGRAALQVARREPGDAI
jgi:hypothetical protein